MGISINSELCSRNRTVIIAMVMMMLLLGGNLFGENTVQYQSDAATQKLVGGWVWMLNWAFVIVGCIGIITGGWLFYDGKQKQGLIIIAFGVVFFKLFDFIIPYMPANSGEIKAKEEAATK